VTVKFLERELTGKLRRTTPEFVEKDIVRRAGGAYFPLNGRNPRTGQINQASVD
jgi:hypothetical protein